MDRRCLMIESNKLVELNRDGPALRLKAQGRSTQWFPLRRLSRVICVEIPDVGMRALAATAAEGIPVTFLRPNGRIEAQLIHPGALPEPFTHWLSAIESEQDVRRAYHGWLDNFLRHSYAMLGCVACTAEKAKDKADLQVRRIARKQGRGRLLPVLRTWLTSLLIAQIQSRATQLGLAANSHRTLMLCDHLMAAGLLLAMTRLLLTLPDETKPEGLTIARLYEREVAPDISDWLARGFYTLSEQLERAAMSQSAPRLGTGEYSYASTPLSRLL
ncbi:MAG: hypothetical protein CMI01_03270 [Oceanospirillaceae bacterium]|nr:hypothetical protein [Oceanospirillaceae bacterium]